MTSPGGGDQESKMGRTPSSSDRAQVIDAMMDLASLRAWKG